MQATHPTYHLATISIATALLLVACKNFPDDVSECPPTSDGTGGCGEVPPPPETPGCAEPEFDTSHPPATEYECAGQAGGAIVYNQVEVKFGGNVLGGGQGSIPDEPEDTEGPEWTPFPTMDHNVSACCHGEDPEDVEASACQRDCGRAAVNDVLARLRDRAMQDDPSNEACDKAPVSFGGPAGCRDNLRKSLESWIEQIECNYEHAVQAAILNSDPDVAYWDHNVPFSNDRKLLFDDPDCPEAQLGCLRNAELRPFCEITGLSTLSSCEQAGNAPDPAADGGCGLDETGEPSSGKPFGDISQLVWCSPQTNCQILWDLHFNVGYNFHVFHDEGVELVPVSTPTDGYKVTGLTAGDHSKELLDAFGIRNDDVITHVNGTALSSTQNTLAVIAMLDDDASPWSVTVRRWTGRSWATLNYSIEFSLTFSGSPGGGDDESEVAKTAASDADKAQTGSCACQAAGASAPSALAVVLLGGVLGRRRRRRTSST